MNRWLVLALCLVLVSCDGQVPWPSPFPSIPIPSPEPVAPYDCANPPALSGVIEVSEPTPESRYVVVLKPRVGALSVLQAEVQAVAARYPVLSQVEALGLLGFRAVTTAAGAAQVAADPEVAYVQRDGVKRVRAVPWGLDRVDQRDLPLDGIFAPGSDGAGIKVFVTDTGVTDIPDFGGRLQSECFTAHTFGGCRDMHGHGQHVAGTIGGLKWGVAKGVTIIPVRVLNEKGSGSDSDVIRGLQWEAQWAREHPGRYVGNMSLGGSAAPALDAALCEAIAAGITFAVAAGNDSEDACGGSPARVKQALTIGASDKRDHAADFSNTGPCVDLWAPGVDVESDTPQGGSTTMSGTSMASPHVAGGAVLCAARGATDPVQCVLDSATPGKIAGGALLYVKQP